MLDKKLKKCYLFEIDELKNYFFFFFFAIEMKLLIYM